MIYKNKKIPNTFGFDVKAASYADYDSVEELENLIACGCIVSPFLPISPVTESARLRSAIVTCYLRKIMRALYCIHVLEEWK